jgi:hypothetical protein
MNEPEKNQPIVGKIFALKFAPEPVKKPSIYERVCRMAHICFKSKVAAAIYISQHLGHSVCRSITTWYEDESESQILTNIRIPIGLSIPNVEINGQVYGGNGNVRRDTWRRKVIDLYHNSKAHTKVRNNEIRYKRGDTYVYRQRSSMEHTFNWTSDEFSLWAADTLERQNFKCAYSGQRLTASTVSLERLDETIGYSPENCILMIIRSDEYHKLGDNAQSTNENWLNELPITKREKIKKQLEHEPIEAKRMKLVLDAVKTDSTKKRKYTRERVLASQSNMKSALIGLCEYNGCLIILFDADVFTNNSFQLCLFYHTDFLKLLDETWRMIGVPLDACGPVVKPLEIWIINKKCVLDYFTYEEIHNYLIPSSLYKKQEHEVDWRGRKFEPDRYENATSTRVINSVQKCREEYPFSFACTKLFGECGGLELCS